jgi:nucleoside-diphosphate-sugar epimerase
VRRLVATGHRVTGLTRTERGRRTLEGLGAAAVIGDALDRDRLHSLIVEAAPTHVAHLLTAIPKAGATRPSDLEATNELRIRGTANLLEAAIAAGATRIVAESYAAAILEPAGLLRPAIEAARELERQMQAASDRIETIVLRYGNLYGAGVPSTEAMVEALRARKLPLMRGASGIASFVHIDDAVAATMAALDRGRSGGIYAIVDDQPVALSEVVLATADAIGAPRPRALPRFVVKLLAPFFVELLDARVVLSNGEAKRELSWTPRVPRYRAA